MDLSPVAARLQSLSPVRFAFSFALAASLGYVLATGHVWEDYLITFRHSKNLAEGRGLVFQPGERVHGFTSPLGVLLPAAFHRALGNPESFLPALWCFRVLGALAFAGGVAFFVRTLVRAGMGVWALAAAMLLTLEIKGAQYSVNGQETGFMIFFLGWSVDLLSRPGPYRWKSLALCWAGLQWTRPDGFVIGGAWALSRIVFADKEDRRALFAAYLKALGLSVVLYAPWIAFTTLYYGTPIPHTVVAKSVKFEVIEPTLRNLTMLVTTTMRWIIEPICFFYGNWPKWESRFAGALAFAGAVLWLFPAGGALSQFARRASFAYVLLLVYFCKITVYACYVPPAAMLMLAGLAAVTVERPLTTAVLMTLSYVAAVLVEEDRLRIGHSSRNLLMIVAVLLIYLSWRTPRWVVRGGLLAGGIAFLATIFGMVTYQMRVQQAVIETRVRMPVGLWLKEHVKPGETVYVECLGYLGYFSNCHMLDFPGLASPTVAKANRDHDWGKDKPTERMVMLIPELKPDWLALRLLEFHTARSRNVLDGYQVRKTFDATEELSENYPDLPGLGYLFNDAKFVILQRDRDAGGSPDPKKQRPSGPDS